MNTSDDDLRLGGGRLVDALGGGQGGRLVFLFRPPGAQPHSMPRFLEGTCRNVAFRTVFVMHAGNPEINK